jgi:hypothetical protein
VNVLVFGVHRPEACDTERVRSRLSFWCVSQEAGNTFNAEVKHGVLTLSTNLTNYGEDYINLIGAVELPCGATVRWNRLQVRDPEWNGVGTSGCEMGCRQRLSSCEDQCRMRHPADFHDDGEPARDQGEDCLSACEIVKCPCARSLP